MPYHLRFGEADPLRIRFAVSPLWETHSAVRVLARPHQQAYHLPWMRRIAGAARELDLGPLHLLMPLSGHSPDFLYPPPLGPVRADVLCALEEPAGTTALAHRLGRAPSSVSAHLAVLRDAGLLTSRRYGHQVLYERTPLGIAVSQPEAM